MHSRKDNIKLDLKETEWEGMDWVNLAPEKNEGQTLVTAVMNLQVSYIAGFFMRIKPTSAYENMRIYYTTVVVGLIHVSATYCGHFQGDVFEGYITSDKTANKMFSNISFEQSPPSR